MSYYSGWIEVINPKTNRKIKKQQTFNEFVHQYFDLVCKKCNSKNVVINYEQEGGYSEYTQWGSSLSIGCNDCGENDITN